METYRQKTIKPLTINCPCEPLWHRAKPLQLQYTIMYHTKKTVDINSFCQASPRFKYMKCKQSPICNSTEDIASESREKPLIVMIISSRKAQQYEQEKKDSCSTQFRARSKLDVREK